MAAQAEKDSLFFEGASAPSSSVLFFPTVGHLRDGLVALRSLVATVLRHQAIPKREA